MIPKRALRSTSVFAFLIISTFTLVLFLFREQGMQLWLKAIGTPANLVVDVQMPLGPIPRPWAHLAQGGEDLTADMLSPVLQEIRRLSPQSIRIDHIYDGYNVVGRNADGQLTFDWSRLDAVVLTIRQSGATPMLVLSYMPPAISRQGIVDPPRDWNEWALVVQRTIEHFSGSLGIEGIAYEVWNEPDLFGGWKTYGERNFLDLYRFAAVGAARARGVKPFQIGGPATTAPYSSWMKSFLDYVGRQNLRLDFLSWHRYGKNIDTYAQDRELIDRELQQYLKVAAGVDRYVTEWGPSGNNDPAYDSEVGAAHLVAVVRAYLGQIDRLYTFEIVDGKSPEGRQFWGRWGLLTHPSTGKREKPRYQALKMLNQLNGLWLQTTGEGSWVKAIATSQEDGTVGVLIVNYDSFGSHGEDVPLQIRGLSPGSYILAQTFLGARTRRELTTIAAEEPLEETIAMGANSVVLVTLTPSR